MIAMFFLQIFKLFVLLLKDLIFDHPDEHNFRSSKFNARKFAVFALVVSLIVFDVAVLSKAVEMAKETTELKAQLLQNCKVVPK